MSALLPRALHSIPLSRPPAHHLRSPAHYTSDMERNYAFAALPSYMRYTRRETIKTDVAKDTTAYANIRQKISSTSLTVSYEKGLNTLRALRRSNDTRSVEIGSILKLQKRRPETIATKRISTKHFISYEAYLPGGVSSRTRLGSEGGSSVKSTESKLSQGKVIRSRPPARRDRMGSETSSTTSRSRPTSYSSWYTDDSLWSDKIDEIKERYAHNSDFITSMRRDRSDNVTELSPHQIKGQYSKMKIPKLKKGGFLPPIPIHDEEQRSGDGSWSSNTTGSSKSVANGFFSTKQNQEQDKDSPNRRKVGFNLKPKRSVRLPQIPLKKDVNASKKPKSILKKYDDVLDELLPSPSPTPFYDDGDVTTRWQVHLPRLRSPVPSARRQPMSFQRQNFREKCSKEFETVASDIQSDKTLALDTD